MRTIRQLIAGILGRMPSNEVSVPTTAPMTTTPANTQTSSSPTDVPKAATTPTGTPNPPSPTNETQDKDEQDVTALKALIAEQRGRGAKVSEDLSSDEYGWENDRLITINWNYKKLSGELNVNSLVNLTQLYCDHNKLTSLDVGSNTALTEYTQTGI